MKLNEYQQLAVSTAIYPKESNIIYPTLGLAGEAGEVANKVKKVLRDNSGNFSDEAIKSISKEVGDCLWYIANIAHDLGYSLEQIAQENADKLLDRKNRGVLGGNGDNR